MRGRGVARHKRTSFFRHYGRSECDSVSRPSYSKQFRATAPHEACPCAAAHTELPTSSRLAAVSFLAHLAAAHVCEAAQALQNWRAAAAHHLPTKPAKHNIRRQNASRCGRGGRLPAMVPASEQIEALATTRPRTRDARAVLLPCCVRGLKLAGQQHLARGRFGVQIGTEQSGGNITRPNIDSGECIRVVHRKAL